MENLSSLSTLDRIRISKGNDRLKNDFLKSINEDKSKAVGLINSEKTSYASLFVLKDEIKNNKLENKINKRNKLALIVTNEILSNKRDFSIISESSFGYVQSIQSTLRWMIKSGHKEDGSDDEYDEVLDKASIILAKIYKDSTILPTIVDMIFNRYTKDLFIHDLVWGYFGFNDPKSLLLVANRLKSPKLKEFELAYKLLGFIPGINTSSRKGSEDAYFTAVKWINENSPYLYATGESYQQRSNPEPYKVNLEAKYICKDVSVESGKILSPISKDENLLLEEFTKQSYENKVLLSSYSVNLHNNDLYKWNMWIHQPIPRKLELAIAKKEGYDD